MHATTREFQPRSIISACLVDMDIGIILLPHGVIVGIDGLLVVSIVKVAWVRLLASPESPKPQIRDNCPDAETLDHNF